MLSPLPEPGWASIEQAPLVLLVSGSPQPAGQIPPPPQLSLCPNLPSPKEPSLPTSNSLSSDPGSTQNSLLSHPSKAQKWAQSFIEGPKSQMQWEGDLIAPPGLNFRHAICTPGSTNVAGHLKTKIKYA